MSYYNNTTYISNSDLTIIRNAMLGTINVPNLQKAYEFGTLVDMLVTENDLVNYEEKEIYTYDGEVVKYTTEEWMRAEAMRAAVYKDPFVASFIQGMNFQNPKYVNDFMVTYNSYVFYMNARCKYDGVRFEWKTGFDLKTTSCTDLKSLIKSIDLFDWDRQAAWYMDLGNLNNFAIIGIRKKANKYGKYEVLPFIIRRGDPTYLVGKRKYEKLAYMTNLYILGLWKQQEKQNEQELK